MIEMEEKRISRFAYICSTNMMYTLYCSASEEYTSLQGFFLTLKTFFFLCNHVVLYTELRPGQICHPKVMHRKEVTHSYGQ